ncbi:MAG TPA: hypothetical protein PKL88_03175, partial [bacterium]|nr:hypothetical protein [bacterium]
MIVRNHRKFLLGTVILLLLVLLIVLSVVFRNAFPSFLPVVTNPSIEDYSSSAPNDNVSPFYDIIGNIEEDT